MITARKLVVLSAAVFLAGASIAEARPGGRGGHGGGHGARHGGGHAHHGHGHGHRPWYGGGYYRPYYRPYFYPYSSFYYPPVYYPPAVYAAPAPAPVYVEQQPHYVEPVQPQPVRPAPQAQTLPEAPSYWYYCDASQAYYPDVGSCAGGWQRVPARPQD